MQPEKLPQNLQDEITSFDSVKLLKAETKVSSEPIFVDEQVEKVQPPVQHSDRKSHDHKHEPQFKKLVLKMEAQNNPQELAMQILWKLSTQAMNSPKVTGAVSLLVAGWAALEAVDYIGVTNIVVGTAALVGTAYLAYKHVPPVTRVIDNKLKEMAKDNPPVKKEVKFA